MKRFAEILLDNRLLILALLGVVTFFFLSGLSFLQIDDDIDKLLVMHDPQLEFFEAFVDEFGHDEIVVVAFEAEDILSKENLVFVDRLESKLAGLNHVHKTLSLRSALDVKVDGDRIELVKIIGKYPETKSDRDAIKRKLRSHPFFYKTLVSEDFRKGAIHLQMDEGIANTKAREELVKSLEVILEEESENGERELYVAGMPVSGGYMTKYLFKDVVLYLPLSIILIVGSMFIIFRNYYLLVLPFITILVSVVWTMGLLSMISGRMNLVSIAIPTMIFVIGTSDCVHILSNFQDSVFNAHRFREAIIRTIGLSTVPCLLTSLTTMIGFVSMLVNDFYPLKQLGVYTAFGIGSAFIICISLLPAFLSYLTHKQFLEYQAMDNPVPGQLRGILKKIAYIATKKKIPVLVVSISLLIFTSIGLPKLYVDTEGTNYFGKDTIIKKSIDFINRNLSGAGVFYAVVDCDKEDCILESQNMGGIERLNNYLKKQEDTGKVFSISDLVKYINYKFNDEQKVFYNIPPDKEQIAQLMLMASFSGEQELLEEFVDSDYKKTFLTVHVSVVDLAAIDSLAKRTRSFIENELSDELDIKLTGRVLLFADMHDPILKGLKNSLFIALFIIFLLVCLTFRSVKVGLLSILPNIIPVGFTFGVMGLLGIPLNFFTSSVACMTFGIAVDDTMHFLTRFRIELKKDGDYINAIYRTLESVGKALIYTSIIFIAGFCIFLTSSFQVLKNFGALVAFTVLGALLADLFLLPALILIFKPFGKDGNKLDLNREKREPENEAIC